jgi:phospholipase C
MRIKARTRWLAGAAVPAALVASSAALLPGQAVRPASAGTSPIQHIVVLDLENQSFDHLLGFWCQTATMPDGVTPRCGTGDAMPASVTLSNGAAVTPSVSPDVVPAESHTVQSQLAAMDGGKMDGWQNEQAGSCAAPAYGCVSGYTPAQIPNIIALANAGAINDRFFEFSSQPSWIGHMYAVAATTDGFSTNNPVKVPGGPGGPGWGCDSNEVANWGPALKSGIGKQVVPSCVPDYALGLPNGGAFRPTPVLNVPTIMDRLDAAGLSWKIYGATKTDKAGPGGQYSGYIWSTCPAFASCLDTPQDGSLVDESQFFTDAAAGTLPNFSLITAGGATIGAADSCHNGFSITACDNYVGQVASAVMNSPQWSSTALLITWDDYGGFYDSQPPPGSDPDGTAEGIRLPLIAVSPYAVPDSTDSTPATFTSILAFTEQNFGLPPLEVNDELAYPLTAMFNLSAPPVRAAKPRMVTRPVPKGDHIEWWEAKQDT